MSTTPTLRLTTGARVIRGGRRIGLFIGAIVLLIGSLAGFGESYSAADRKVSSYHQAKCLRDIRADNLRVRTYVKSSTDEPDYLFAENGCPGPAYSATEAEIRTMSAGPAPSFTGTMFGQLWPWLFGTVLAAASAFAVCWGLGWVAAGFTAD